MPKNEAIKEKRISRKMLTFDAMTSAKVTQIATATATQLPTGASTQTLRYDATNALIASPLLKNDGNALGVNITPTAGDAVLKAKSATAGSYAIWAEGTAAENPALYVGGLAEIAGETGSSALNILSGDVRIDTLAGDPNDVLGIADDGTLVNLGQIYSQSGYEQRQVIGSYEFIVTNGSFPIFNIADITCDHPEYFEIPIDSVVQLRHFTTYLQNDLGDYSAPSDRIIGADNDNTYIKTASDVWENNLRFTTQYDSGRKLLAAASSPCDVDIYWGWNSSDRNADLWFYALNGTGATRTYTGKFILDFVIMPI